MKKIVPFLLLASFNVFAQEASVDCDVLKNLIKSNINSKLSIVQNRIERDKETSMKSKFMQDALQDHSVRYQNRPGVFHWIGDVVEKKNTRTGIGVYYSGYGNNVISAYSSADNVSRPDQSQDIKELNALLNSLRREGVPAFTIMDVGFEQNLSQTNPLKFKKLTINNIDQNGELLYGESRHEFSSLDGLIRFIALPKQCGGTTDWSKILDDSYRGSKELDSTEKSEERSSATATAQ